jgi:hypothetical protein
VVASVFLHSCRAGSDAIWNAGACSSFWEQSLLCVTLSMTRMLREMGAFSLASRQQAACLKLEQAPAVQVISAMR